jgi:hypothetical protein
MNRRYVIFSVNELPLINFDEVLETSVDTLRYSIDRSLTFVKYDLPAPACVEVLTTKTQEYTQEEIKIILRGVNWSKLPSEITGSL